MLALLFPTVILLSAVATLIGAGAHLITVSVLWEATGDRIGFTQWLLLGLPLAVASSHLAAETVLLTTTRRTDRAGPVRITAEEIQRHSESPVTGPWTQAEKRCALLLATVVALWCSEPLHQVSPAVVALIGAVVASSPALGTVRLKDALKTVPWSLLLFMAATMAMGVALADSGAAKWLVSGLPADVAPGVFLGVVVAVSTAAHLVLQSRSARSSVLVPLVISAAVGAGVNPVAAALASTAAAGFCHTLPASAKPVTLFSDVPGVPTYTPRDLLRLSAVLAPLTALLVLFFAAAVWPLLGVPVTR
ncbi:SLC13 family permease OS=Streptomyces tendae OX=1932 GN=GUR47_11750 PE=4 SV=1 [Streptomyces tendae]